MSCCSVSSTVRRRWRLRVSSIALRTATLCSQASSLAGSRSERARWTATIATSCATSSAAAWSPSTPSAVERATASARAARSVRESARIAEQRRGDHAVGLRVGHARKTPRATRNVAYRLATKWSGRSSRFSAHEGRSRGSARSALGVRGARGAGTGDDPAGCRERPGRRFHRCVRDGHHRGGREVRRRGRGRGRGPDELDVVEQRVGGRRRSEPATGMRVERRW